MGKQIVEGKIDKIYVKDFGEQDQYGNQFAVNVNIGGNWYGLGKKKKPVANIKVGSGWHQLAEGDFVEAVCETVERGGRTYNNIRSSDVTLKEAGSGGKGGVCPSNGGSGSNNFRNGSSPMNNDDRQAAIMRQSAMGYAAQIVAATMNSKSSLDRAAEDVVRIASAFFVPYAEKGLAADETRMKEENELKNQEAAQAASEDEFGDSIPF